MSAPHPLDYETPRPGEKRVSRFSGWWIVLAALPALVFCLSLPRYPIFSAILWAYLAIGLPAEVGLIRRERSRTWIVYLILTCLLPFLAGGTEEAWVWAGMPR